jgi:hypothetical protein
MQILHTSIPVRYPKRIAQALAELVDGETFDFLHPGCYFVTIGEPGSLIELYRKEIELHPGEPGQTCYVFGIAMLNHWETGTPYETQK